ncbi:MAG: hypothetical protein BGO52_02805 [Sphingobacteriales bacterium 44-61]|jgi:hypothetical protein|nr:MAG: hypothetical protein BGO52_02805 [Sphingobacteriales bacterium 44-61]
MIMKTFTSIAVIECSHSASSLWKSATSPVNGGNLKKVLPKGSFTHNLSRQFPEAEIVSNSNDILNDESIDLIILADPASSDLGIAAAALEAGKSVRIL